MTTQGVPIDPKGQLIGHGQSAPRERLGLPVDYDDVSHSWRYGYSIGGNDILVDTVSTTAQKERGEVPNMEVNVERRARRAAEEATQRLKDVGSSEYAVPWMQRQKRVVRYIYETSKVVRDVG